MAQREFIPNQVFIGLPWKNVRKRYESVIDRLKIRSPLSFVIVGRGDEQDAEDLLEVIKGKLENSSYAVFDATWGNANVSLEYGYAEAKNIPRVLYLSTHKAARKVRDAAIISDLAGKKRNSYATEKGLFNLLQTFSDQHPYTKRFAQAVRREIKNNSKGEKKRLRSLALKVIHRLDGESDIRREDIVQSLLADSVGYSKDEITDMLRTLHKRDLIYVEPGRYSSVSIA
jgi:hypothetical protein